jgi:tRNA (guanine37-N1)-methyltransferase
VSPLYLALLHHPVKSRDGSVIATAVTNLDVHDLARLGRTYDARAYFIATPITAQRTLVGRILDHWRTGAGGRRIPDRGEALSIVEPVESLAAAIERVIAREGDAPRVVATAARAPADVAVTSFAEVTRLLEATSTPTLILFGTGHGLTDELLRSADLLLPPVRPRADYNHLSVRAAAAIVLDRLIGD